MVEEAIIEQAPVVAKAMPAPGHDPKQAAERGKEVESCFHRFATGELNGERVGRIGVAVFPALGEQYGREVAARRDEMGALVIRGLAVGYVFLDRAFYSGGEKEFITRPPEEVWNAWTTRLNTGFLEAAGAPPETVSVLRRTGARLFRDSSKEVGLRGRKLKRIGAYYAQAGAELRMVQSQPDLTIAASPWPFESIA